MTEHEVVTRDGRAEAWIVVAGIGGWVCAEPGPGLPGELCGIPVEDEPCSLHHPLGDDRPLLVTICGSTRFRQEIADANRELTLAGDIVLAPGVFQHTGDQITEDQKAALDNLHLHKIDVADEVYVVNPGGYLGESTLREIAYALRTGKPVRYAVACCEAHDRGEDRCAPSSESTVCCDRCPTARALARSVVHDGTLLGWQPQASAR